MDLSSPVCYSPPHSLFFLTWLYITYLTWKCNHSSNSGTICLNKCHLNICDVINIVYHFTFAKAKIICTEISILSSTKKSSNTYFLNEWIYLTIEQPLGLNELLLMQPDLHRRCQILVCWNLRCFLLFNR